MTIAVITYNEQGLQNILRKVYLAMKNHYNIKINKVKTKTPVFSYNEEN